MEIEDVTVALMVRNILRIVGVGAKVKFTDLGRQTTRVDVGAVKRDVCSLLS